jgi:hypothetical protein
MNVELNRPFSISFLIKVKLKIKIMKLFVAIVVDQIIKIESAQGIK